MSSIAELPQGIARLRALDALLEQALALDDAPRHALLAALMQQDAPAAAVLQRLLASANTDNVFLDGVAWGKITIEHTSAHLAGAMVGPYQLVEKLGAGGMGEVWLANAPAALGMAQVAIKLIRSPLSPAVMAARLRRERDLLIRLLHPGIARLQDSGVTVDGLPYLVLEYVQGISLLAFASERQLNVRARVQLFAQVCEAVAAAQAQLIVHRDIKPQNILVTATGQAKLLDFGIAKLLDDSGVGASTELTAQGGRALTPAYASPEQLMGESVSTASDVYSLGIVLHELLLGQRPARPGLQSGMTLPSVLAKRGLRGPGLAASPRGLAVELRGDLDCLMQRALEPMPADRYVNAQALASDLSAYLNGRSLQAGPNSGAYRFAKFIKRHPLASASVSTALLAVIAASVFALQSARESQREAARSAYTQRFIEAVFSSDLPGAPRDQLPSTELLLKRGSAQALADVDAEPGARLALLLALSRIQQGHRLFDAAEQSLQAAQSLLDQIDDEPPWRAATISAELAGLRAQRMPGEHKQGVDALQAAIDQAQAHGAPATWIVEALNSLTGAYVDVDRGDASRATALRALQLLKSIEKPLPALRLNTLTQAVAAYTHDQQFRAEAEGFARAALQIAEQHFGAEHSETAYASMRLALALRIKGELAIAQTYAERAVKIARLAYPATHPQLARILEEAARIAMRLNQNSQGIALWREVLQIRRAQQPDSAQASQDFSVLRTKTFLASALLRSGEYQQAAQLALPAASALRATLGIAHPIYLDACSYAVEALITLDRSAEALALLPDIDAAMPDAIAPQSRWRFLELQLYSAALQPANMRAQAIGNLVARIDNEKGSDRDIALLLLRASAFAIENDAMGIAKESLAFAGVRLAVDDRTLLLEVHELLTLLAINGPLNHTAVNRALATVQLRRGERNFAVRLGQKRLLEK